MVRRRILPAAGLLCAALIAAPPAALAVSVTNGDFATGDFTGWTTDTDGGAGAASDFSVIGPAGAHRAQIEVDYWSVPGDLSSTALNTVLFANTLTQELDTALSAGAMMRLTFDWLFTGQDGNATSGDIFSVALNDGLGNLYGADGTLGFLIDPIRVYGSGTYSAVLDRIRFGNQTGWFLDLQLAVGVDGFGQPNALGSTVRIGNVTLTEFYDAPAPAPLALVLPTASASKPWPPTGPRSPTPDPTRPRGSAKPSASTPPPPMTRTATRSPISGASTRPPRAAPRA